MYKKNIGSKMRIGFLILCATFLCASALVFSQRAAAPSIQDTSLSPAWGAPELYKKGQELQLKEDWYGATESYLEALRLNPAYAQAFQALGECAYAMGEYELAIKYLDNASLYLKNNIQIQNLKGFSLIGLGKLAEARTIFTSTLVQYPNDADARFGLAELDIFDGRISSAEQLYTDALKRQPQNRKALLSLALVSYELGKTAEAKKYIDQALRYHGDSASVHYFAGYLAAQNAAWNEAEGRVRSAIQLKPDYDKAYELLSAILYRTSRYEEVIDTCDYRINRNRNLLSAWYLKAISLARLNRSQDALNTFEVALQIAPEDEIVRAAMELLLLDTYQLEDARRTKWAQYHIQKAQELEKNFYSDQALYEYRRALKLDPYNINARMAYASILLRNAYPQRYVDQLRFIQSLGKSTVQINDSIEAYQALLRDSLPTKWNIDTFNLNKTHYTLSLYYVSDVSNFIHPDAEKVSTSLLADVLNSEGTLKVTAQPKPVSGFAEAFRLARQSAQDYFGIVSFSENDRDIQINVELYVSRTGNLAQKISVFRTGNGRYSNAMRRLSRDIASLFPVKGSLIARNGNNGVIDLGLINGVQKDQQFTIVRSGHTNTQDDGLGIIFSEDNVVGTFTATVVDEDITQGVIQRNGFYDRINIGDTVVLVTETTVPAVQAPIIAPDIIQLIQSVQ